MTTTSLSIGLDYKTEENILSELRIIMVLERKLYSLMYSVSKKIYLVVIF